MCRTIKNREALTITPGWKLLNKKLEVACVTPHNWVIDNKAPQLLKTTMLEAEMHYQLVLHYVHCANLAERAIQNFKNHFKLILATTDPNFPVGLWDLRLKQTLITLNLL